MKTIHEHQLHGEAGRLRLAMHQGRLHLWVRPTVGEQEWQSPVLAVEIINRMEERVECITDLHVMHVAEEEKGLHGIVRDGFRGITLGLWIAWVDGELSVLVPPAEIEEAKEALYRVHSVMVLPDLMAAGPDGRLLLPINTGALCAPADKPKLSDRFLIYGEQERWELVPMLPVSGVQSTRGGIVCLAREGACDAWCAVDTDGAGNGTVAMGAMLRRQWIDPVDWMLREFRYQFLPARQDLVHAAARRVRRHVVEDLGMPTLAQRAEESPQCAYQQSSYTMKLFHGIQRQGIMMYEREIQPDELFYMRVMTFRQAEAALLKLKAAGVDRVYAQSVGWNPRGHDGAWPTDFPIDQRLGGEAGLRALIETAKTAGYQITTHLNLGMSCFSSPDYCPDYVIQDIWHSPKVTGDWGGGIHGTHWGLALPTELVEGRILAVQRLGFNGMQYLDFQGNPLYVNYHPRYGGPRADFAAGIRRYQEAARRITGGVQIEAGFLYCATQADAINAPYYQCFRPWKLSNTAWPVVQLIDRQVPVYQLAMHGLVAQEQQGLGWACTMNAILYGRVLRDEWSTEPGVMPVLDDTRIAQIKAMYDLVTVRFGDLVTQELCRWESMADLVEKTVYADGTEVLADFDAKRLWVNGEEIPQPAVFADVAVAR